MSDDAATTAAVAVAPARKRLEAPPADDDARQPARFDLDEAIHQPVRLSIMAILAEGERVDFAFLRSYLKLGESNLSRHLTSLEALGYIHIEKVFEGKRGRTWLSLTEIGRDAFDRHVRALRRLVEDPMGERRTR